MFGKKKEVSRIEIFENMEPTRAVITLAVPTIVNQLVNVIYNLADSVYIGRLNNPSMLAALSLTTTIMILLTACGNLFVVGGCAIISKALGEKDLKKAENVATMCPLLAVCFGAVISVIAFIFLEQIALYAGATETSLEYTKQYMFWVIAMNAIPNITSVTIGAGLRGRGYAKYEMLGISFGNILNIVLDPIFIFGFKMGVEGAALATFLSNVASLIFFLIIAMRMQKKEHLYCPLREYRFNPVLAKEVMATGFPAFFHQFVVSIAQTRFMNLMKTYSDAAIAANGIVRKLEHTMGQIVIGLNQGVIPLLAYNYGNKNFERLNTVRRRTVFVAIGFGIVSAIVLLPFARFFVSLFIEDAETVEFGIMLLRVFALSPLAMSYNSSCRTAFQALGKKRDSTIISFTRNFILFVPLMYIMNHFWSIKGLAISSLLCDGIIDVVAFFIMRRLMINIKEELS